MKKRMLTVIGDSPMANYIAINELKFDVVHCIYTPHDADIKKRLESLQTVVRRNHPEIEFELHPQVDPYDSKETRDIAFKLLTEHDSDDWWLNRTTGTEQMRAPLAAVFDKLSSEPWAIYVETKKGQIALINSAWVREEYKFQNGISVQDYFELHGQYVHEGTLNESTEIQLHNDLKRLDFHDICPSCTWHGASNYTLAEWDIAATYNYQLYVFERKKLQDGNAHTPQTLEQNAAVLHDIEKLAYTRAIFGGPFGKVYWLLSGSYDPKPSIKDRMQVLKINYIRGKEIVDVANNWKQHGLPPLKPKQPNPATPGTPSPE